ncbi:hypothetical protein KFO27_23130 [Aeromonas salmonicida]|nr:hypothetical protein [Aeromonas salmonicida]
MSFITVQCPRCNSGRVYRHGKTPAGHVEILGQPPFWAVA